METLDGLLRDALLSTATLALPTLAVAVVQAATQVQEQTLTLLPKVVALGLMVAIFGPMGMHLLVELFDRAVAAIPALAGS